MNIGIDVDGVLTDIRYFEISKGEKFFKKNVTNIKGLEIKDIFDVSKEDANDFWNKHMEEYATVYPARPNASLITNKLHADGFHLTIITARKYENGYTFMKPDEMPKYVVNWLKKNDIYFDDVVFTKESKRNAIIDNKIDYMVDDSPKNIEELSFLTKVIVYDDPSNEHMHGENIYHVKSWQEIYDIITKQKEL